MSDTTTDDQPPAQLALSHHAEAPDETAGQVMPAQTQQYQEQENVPTQCSVGQVTQDQVHPGQYTPGTAPPNQLPPQHMPQSQGPLSAAPHVYQGPPVYPGQAPPVYSVPGQPLNGLPPAKLSYSGQQSYYVLRSESGATIAVFVTLDISYIKSIQGLLQLLLFVTLTVAWSCCLEVDRQCRITVLHLSPDSYKAKVKFSMFAFTSGWIVVLLIFMTRFTQLHKSQCIARLKWPLLCLIIHFLWMVFTLIAAALLASEGKIFRSTSSALVSADAQAYINNFWAALAFGFISWALFLVHLYFYYVEYNQNKLQTMQQPVHVQADQSFGATFQEVP